MNLPPFLGRTWEALLDSVFPPKCGGCGRVGQWLCDVCRSQISYVNIRAVEPTPKPWDSSTLQHAYSIAWFEEPLRTAIHNFKYNGQRALRKPLAQLFLGQWEKLKRPTDLLVAVPLHRKREKERGYNQSYLLASELGHALQIPAPQNGLRRVRHTLPQVSLNMEQRWQNVQEAFQGNPAVLGGKSVLLVDDVCTTGATLEACARAATQAGARFVWALTLARPKASWE